MIASLLLAASATAAAPAPSPRAELKAAVEKLQASPDDQSLRERIIKLARSLKPAPAVPEEARRHFVKGVTLQKDAKSAEDYAFAEKEYRAALLACPWWPDAYFNAATVLQSDGKYDEAIRALKLFVLASPKGADARAAQDKIYALEAKAERDAARRDSPEGRRADALKGLSGGIWKRTMVAAHNYANGSDWPEKPDNDGGARLEVRGDVLRSYFRGADGSESPDPNVFDAATIESRHFTVEKTSPDWRIEVSISPDGRTVTLEGLAQPQPSMSYKYVYTRIQ